MRSLAFVAALAAAAFVAVPSAQAYDERPMRLPAGPGFSAAAAEPSTWIVGAERGARSSAIARRYGARLLRTGHAYSVKTSRARGFAAALRGAGLLTYAEPNVRLRRSSAFDTLPDAWARGAVVDPGLAPPAPVPAASIAVVDDLVDTSLPDLGSNTQLVNPGPVLGPHGTMVASAAAGALQGTGVFGIFPGARIISVGLPLEISCGDAANGVIAAANADARVINLSFGSPQDCITLYAAVQIAYASGSLVVAAAGNEFAAGNPVIYPAAYPHVLSVAAVDQSLAATGFSSENTAVDVAAPGAGVPLAIPPQFDEDGTRDGLTLADGTSFATPIVAGAAAWLAAAKPALTNGQIADILRRSAIDVGPRGYDQATGFGVVKMSRALVQPIPREDILEPNDGITFVNGSVFGKPDPYVWRGVGKRTISGSADQIEDPVDVYRVQIPRRARFRIRLYPNFGDPDLYVYRGTATELDDDAAVAARSTRPTGKIDSVTLVNNTRQQRTIYVAIDVATDDSGALNTDYRLEFRRLKRR